MMYPLVTNLAKDLIPVRVSCRVLGFSPQGYYKWRKQPCSKRDYEQAQITNAIHDIHYDDPAFGYRFITDELHRQGFDVSETRVQRLCQQAGIWSCFSKKRGLNRKAGPPVHDDLVQRDFRATTANETWVGDITEHPTTEGKLYLCVFKDLWSNRITGYSINHRMTSRLAVNALYNAAHGRDTRRTIVHTDRGSQFRSRAFMSALKDLEMRGSMGRVGACGDNAAAETFFALLQKNVLNRQRWNTRTELQDAIITWIETTYHRRRKQRRLGKLTPIDYENQRQPAA